MVILMMPWVQKSFASLQNSPHFADRYSDPEGGQLAQIQSQGTGFKEAENELLVTETLGLKVQKVTHRVQQISHLFYRINTELDTET